MQALLNFIVITSKQSCVTRAKFAMHDQARQLYRESMRMFSQSIQMPARQAICSLVKDDQVQQVALLK